MKKRLLIIPIVILIAVLALAALSTPAMAAPCKPAVSTSGAGSYGTNGSLNGTVYEDGDGESELGDDYELVDFEDIPTGVTVKWARVYWHIWGGNPQSGGWTNATFCNATQCWTDNQSIPAVDGAGSPNNCQNDETDGFYMGGSGTHWAYWNVTDKVSAGSNNLTVDNTDWWDGRCMWVYMVAVLENTTKYSEMHYWVNQGYEDLGATTSTTWFNGPVTTGRNGTLWHLALCAGQSKGVYFNNHKVHDGIPRDSVTKEIIPSGWIENDNTQNMTWDNTVSTDPSVHPVMGIFMDKVEQDLTVTEIDVGTPRPNHASTIKATVKNWGSVNIDNQFNVSLYVNDVLNSTKQTVASLNAGSSTEVSFTGVNLPKGCYDFKVIADIDGDIPESNENNNATTVKAQVGYVIVVESYGDFDDLVTESNAGLLGAGSVSHSGDTYYIKNFTGSSAIVNCAGDGISIQNLNTSTKFEIKNCTIEDCTRSGVKFHNLSNGTIKDSTVQNNTNYGIEVGEVPLGSDDPDNVNITNNTISDTEIDVLLIGFNATVSNNTILNNTDYAIYLYGNDSNVTYNILKNNTGYAIKAYNSSDNYIYENDFICNNVSNFGHQAYDNKNSNHWNTSTVGNNWTDWDDNAGAPGEYNIDGGGGNKDYKPRGLYVFCCNASVDKWAFWKQLTQAQFNSGSPIYPSTEFTDAQYDKIKVDDNNRQDDQTSLDTYYAAHRFNFSVDVTSGIDKINVTWNGKGDHDSATKGAKLYIFNFSATAVPYYDELASTTAGPGEVTLTGGKTNATGNIFDYINGNNVTILVNQTSAQIPPPPTTRKSYIKTDYVKLVITPE